MNGHKFPGIIVAIPGILFLLVLTSCSNSPTPEENAELFALGESLCLEQRWGEARIVLREFLMDNPNHPGAHFYLGRSYLFWEEDFRPAIAEGELQTAFQLFMENDLESQIDRFSRKYFLIICNIETVKVCLKEYDFLQSLGAPKSRLRPIALRARMYLDVARRVDAEHKDVIDFEEPVRLIEAATS